MPWCVCASRCRCPHHVPTGGAQVLNHLSNNVFWRWERAVGTLSVRHGQQEATCSVDVAGAVKPGARVKIDQETYSVRAGATPRVRPHSLTRGRQVRKVGQGGARGLLLDRPYAGPTAAGALPQALPLSPLSRCRCAIVATTAIAATAARADAASWRAAATWWVKDLDKSLNLAREAYQFSRNPRVQARACEPARPFVPAARADAATPATGTGGELLLCGPRLPGQGRVRQRAALLHPGAPHGRRQQAAGSAGCSLTR